MPNNDDHRETLAKKLRKAGPKPNLIKLPGAITFTIKDATVRLHLTSSCVEANMQDNASSFEGWALALMRWLPDEVSSIELSWDFSGRDCAPHYQRFLFRVQQFDSLFPWFSIASSQEKDELLKLRTDAGGRYVVTTPKKDRETPLKDACEQIGDARRRELKLECFIRDHPEELAQLLGITQLDRQFPVGVFAGSVSKANEIFPRGHSAIDLLGVNHTELFLFELKADNNTRIGILTELFFYSYVMERTHLKLFEFQQGCFKFKIPKEDIASQKAIRAYILAPKWHSLIDVNLLQMANDAFRTANRQIRFGAITIAPEEAPAYKLKLKACD